jgi:hypothetical protein
MTRTNVAAVLAAVAFAPVATFAKPYHPAHKVDPCTTLSRKIDGELKELSLSAVLEMDEQKISVRHAIRDDLDQRRDNHCGPYGKAIEEELYRPQAQTCEADLLNAKAHATFRAWRSRKLREIEPKDVPSCNMAKW